MIYSYYYLYFNFLGLRKGFCSYEALFDIIFLLRVAINRLQFKTVGGDLSRIQFPRVTNVPCLLLRVPCIIIGLHGMVF